MQIFAVKHYDEIYEIVKKIISDVQTKGDQALISLTAKLDSLDVSSMDDLTISKERLKKSLKLQQLHSEAPLPTEWIQSGRL